MKLATENGASSPAMPTACPASLTGSSTQAGASSSSLSSCSISPPRLRQARNPTRRSSRRAAWLSHSVVAVRSVKPLACACSIVRLVRAVPMPILWNASATSIASSAAFGSICVAHVSGDPHDRVVALIDRGDGLVVEVVDVGEVRELARCQLGLRREEPSAARFRAEVSEQIGQSGTVRRAELPERDRRSIGQDQGLVCGRRERADRFRAHSCVVAQALVRRCRLCGCRGCRETGSPEPACSEEPADTAA